MNKPTLASAVFFCSMGWIYAGQAMGDEAAVGAEAPADAAAVNTEAVEADETAAVETTAEAAEPADPAPAAQPEAQTDTVATPGGVFESTETGPALPAGQTVNVSTFGQIDLHVKDLDLAQVLQLLSIQSQRNIVASRNVSGTVSADLYQVDFYEALDAILHSNGFGYREKGSFIYVYTAAEMKAQEEAERKTTSRLVRLNYITAADASTFVTPLLSSAGSIAVSGEATQGMQPTISDAGANSFAHADTLIIRDYPENVDEIVAVVNQLDVRPKQVLVEASILQANLSEQNAWGVDLTILADFALDQFTSPLGVVDDILDGGVPGTGGAGQTTVGNTQSGNSGLKIGIIGSNVSAFIRALDLVTDTTVLANPKILVLNRQRADLLVGGRLGYLSSTATDTSTTQTVEFLDEGTQLTLRPFVSEDDFIRLELRPSISDGDTTRVVDGFVIPSTTTQELTTNVIVRNGQTIVLGGLFKEDTTVSRNQVPFLGDIPFVGAPFKGQDDTVNRQEVIFLITPTVMKDESLAAGAEAAKTDIERVSVGARTGLLPWSRSKMTAGHMRDAVKAMDSGDTKKALWSANMALSLDPTLVEALRMKEQITGERTYWPSRSLLKNSVDTMIAEQMKTSEAPAQETTPAAETTASADAPEADSATAVIEAVPTAATAGVETEGRE